MKKTFVKSAAQGGDTGGGGGGGPPGTWELVDNGSETVNANDNLTVASLPFPGATEIYMVIASIAASPGGLPSLGQGNVNVPPASSAIIYGQGQWAGGVTIVIRGGALIGAGNVVTWAVYKVTN